MAASMQLRLHQQLALTPQLQQAIRLLRLSQLELVTELRQYAEANPLLEFLEDRDEPPTEADNDHEARDETHDDETGRENGDDTDRELDFSSSAPAPATDLELPGAQEAAPENLRDHLSFQLNLLRLTPAEYLIAEVIVDALDSNGYLREDLETLGACLAPELIVTPAQVEAVRQRIKTLDPIGVASTNLSECLLAQLDELAPDTPHLALARGIVNGEMRALAHCDTARISRRLHAPTTAVSAACELVRSLNPHPGAALDATPVGYLRPDAHAWLDHDRRWHVTLAASCQPRLELNRHYCDLIHKASHDDASYLRGQLQEARWLLKSLEARADTVLKVATAIVERQHAFLDYGPEAMRPLVLREIAQAIGMHESTVSRVTTRKYLRTPRGTFEFKHFFSSHIDTIDGGSASSTAIQAMLRTLVSQEDSCHPYSDQALAEQFRGRGIHVARRTIAKYREAMRIPSSSARQRASQGT